MGKRISLTTIHGSRIAIEQNELKKLRNYWNSLPAIDKNIQRNFFMQTKGLDSNELENALKALSPNPRR